MIPDYLIYDQLIRERENESDWQPEPLHLPLYVPDNRAEEDAEEERDESQRGVVIIDMNGGFDI